MKRTMIDRLMPSSATVAVAAILAATELPAVVKVKCSAWRGETIVVRLRDFDVRRTPPPGLTLREGRVEPVRYRTDAAGIEDEAYMHYGWVADRVVWGGNGDGPRVMEISVDPEARAGVYDFDDIRLTVSDRVLPPPREWKYYLDLWQHPWAVARVKGVEPFSKAHYDAMRPVYELLATAGQKCITATLLEEPWNHQCYDAYHAMVAKHRAADGSWSYDYSVFDEYVAFAESCGIGPDIACYTMCPWGDLVDWIDPDGKVSRAAAPPGSDFFREYWTSFLIDFAKHLKEKRWLGRTFIAMDERRPEDVRRIVSLVRAVAPGLKVSMPGDLSPEEVSSIGFDNYCSGLSKVTPAFCELARQRRRQGLVTTCYVCCGPAKPNTFLSANAGEAYWLGLYPATSGLDGFLRWAWNSWGSNPTKDGSYGYWRSGDVYLCYPDGEPSWRFLQLRAGIAAAEKYHILKASGTEAERLTELDRMFDVKAAMGGKLDFRQIRVDAEAILNR